MNTFSILAAPAEASVRAVSSKNWLDAVRADRRPDGRQALDACVRRTRAAGVSLDAPLDNGATPLQLAVAGGHVEAVRFLLAMGAAPNAADVHGVSRPLGLAMGHAPQGRAHRCAIVVALLKAGAKPAMLGDAEATAVLWGAAEHCPGCAERLLAAGARVPAGWRTEQREPLFRVLAQSLLGLVCDGGPLLAGRLAQWRALATLAVRGGADPAARDAASVPSAQWLAQAVKSPKWKTRGAGAAWDAWRTWRQEGATG